MSCFFNTCGPGKSSDFVILKFIKAALSGSDLILYGESRQGWAFCYIDDNIEATRLVKELTQSKSTSSTCQRWLRAA